MAAALRDRLLETTPGRLARALGVTRGELEAMLGAGPPARWSTRRLEEFAAKVAALVAWADKVRSPEQRERMRQRRARPVYSVAARRAAARALERALLELAPRKVCEDGRWTPHQALASELDCKPRQLRSWLEAGEVPERFMERFDTWAQEKQNRELGRLAITGRLEQLIELAKRPAYEHTLPGSPRKFGAKTPEFKTRAYETQSIEQSGFEWTLKVETWCSFELIERLYDWARTRTRPRPALYAKRWVVTAFCTLYDPEEETGRRRRKSRKGRSPGKYREFRGVGKRDQQIGKDLELGAPISSGVVDRGGLARAAALFRENLTIEFCENELCWVHGVSVRNARIRSQREQDAYRERYDARARAEMISRRQKRERQLERERRAARKKAAARGRANERRGSAAGSTRGRPARASAGARSRKQKR